MIKFGNSIIDDCNFNNINILCYEPHTCKSITYNNTKFSDDEAQNIFKICTKEEINEILNQNNEKSNSIFIIIIGSVVIVFIGVIATFIFIKKNKYIKHKRLVSSFNKEIKGNDATTPNDKSNKTDDEINNNNNNNKTDNEINNNNNNNNNNNQNNLNQNKNIMVNLNDMMEDFYKDESCTFSYSFSYSLSPSFSNSLSPSFSNSLSPSLS